MYSKNPSLKLFLLAISSIVLSITNNTAQADFYKALEAYQNRDGATMLVEVKDAVDKKNDDGLMLLLMVIRIERFQSDRKFFYYHDDNHKPSTLKTILTAAQLQQIYDLLLTATNSSTAESRQNLSPYYFFDDKNTINRLARIQDQNNLANGDNFKSIYKARMPNVDSYIIGDKTVWAPKIDWVKYEDALFQSANAGNPQAQLEMAYIYFGGSTCTRLATEPKCIQEDKSKGVGWLKESIKNFEKRGKSSFGYPYKTSICEFFSTSNLRPWKAYKRFYQMNLREKHLWCLNEYSYPLRMEYNFPNSQLKFDKSLDVTVPEINAISGNEEIIRDIIATGNLLPDMMKEAREKLIEESMPVFSFYVKDNLTYKIEVYPDGRIMIGFDEWPIPLWMDESKSLLMKVPPQTITNFLSDLKKIGFYDMALYGAAFDDCKPWGCDTRKFEFTLVNDKIFKRVYRSDKDQNIDFLNQNSRFNKEIAPIVVLVEKYFPTKKLRCEIGSSEKYIQACTERENQWRYMANSKK